MRKFTFNRQEIKKIFLVLLLLTNILEAFAQDNHLDCEECSEPFVLDRTSYIIEYGNAINFKIANPYDVQINWIISGNSKGSKNGIGNETGTVLFDTPGNYQVTFSSSASGKYLAYTQVVNIVVQPNGLKFLIDKAKLSNPIVSGQSVEGIVLTIPVEVKSFDGSKVNYGSFKNSSTGIEGIDFVFDDQVELTPGIHDLKFKLHGTPQSSGPCQIGLFNLIGEGYFYNFLISK